ncbi:hypothetical protein LCGC14_1375820 [marine sediment metagenome]|uniref:Uncharacterized protein n=1 Tax=marine sediment metagenome TaxID=412755 RepID=A0A0F9K4I5_9ZZZZ
MGAEAVLEHIRKGMKSARKNIPDEEDLVEILNAYMELEKKVKVCLEKDPQGTAR